MLRRRPSQRYQPSDHDRNMVEAWVINGVDRTKMARMLGVSTDTLYKAYGPQLEYGNEAADGAITANIKRQLLKDDLRTVAGGMLWLSKRVKAFAPTPAANLLAGIKTGQEMRLVVVNNPEADLDEFKVADQGTIEVSGHDPEPSDESK